MADERDITDGGTPGTGDTEMLSGRDAPAPAEGLGDDRADGLGGVDAGSPGGMGGVGTSGATGTGRPPGGVSPVPPEEQGR